MYTDLSINKMLELTVNFQVNVKKLFCSLRWQGKRYFENSMLRDFPGGPVVKTSLSNEGDVSLILDQEANSPHTSWPKIQSIKQK